MRGDEAAPGGPVVQGSRPLRHLLLLAGPSRSTFCCCFLWQVLREGACTSGLRDESPCPKGELTPLAQACRFMEHLLAVSIQFVHRRTEGERMVEGERGRQLQSPPSYSASVSLLGCSEGLQNVGEAQA